MGGDDVFVRHLSTGEPGLVAVVVVVVVVVLVVVVAAGAELAGCGGGESGGGPKESDGRPLAGVGGARCERLAPKTAGIAAWPSAAARSAGDVATGLCDTWSSTAVMRSLLFMLPSPGGMRDTDIARGRPTAISSSGRDVNPGDPTTASSAPVPACTAPLLPPIPLLLLLLLPTAGTGTGTVRGEGPSEPGPLASSGCGDCCGDCGGGRTVVAALRRRVASSGAGGVAGAGAGAANAGAPGGESAAALGERPRAGGAGLSIAGGAASVPSKSGLVGSAGTSGSDEYDAENGDSGGAGGEVVAVADVDVVDAGAGAGAGMGPLRAERAARSGVREEVAGDAELCGEGDGDGDGEHDALALPVGLQTALLLLLLVLLGPAGAPEEAARCRATRSCVSASSAARRWCIAESSDSGWIGTGSA